MRALSCVGAMVFAAIVVVDGDTVDMDGARYRLLGYDTPETYWARCTRERELGNDATSRLKQLLDLYPWNMEWNGARDRYWRRLGRLYVNGEDVAETAIREGWGVRYNGRGRRKDWCSG
ncbi:MAG: thermonuclease family protein [Hyphomicrobiaceae bacterium]